jgi:hypothetical protein
VHHQPSPETRRVVENEHYFVVALSRRLEGDRRDHGQCHPVRRTSTRVFWSELPKPTREKEVGGAAPQRAEHSTAASCGTRDRNAGLTFGAPTFQRLKGAS